MQKHPRVMMQRDGAQLVVVDMQQKMMAQIDDAERVRRQALRMLRAAHELSLPITVSEQYVRGLGLTEAEIRAAALSASDSACLEKMSFSVMRDEGLQRRIAGLGGPFVLLMGVETHVCVQQTALDLLQADQTPVILADACGSRRESDRALAIERLRAAGAIITSVEAAIFELLEIAGTDEFKRILPIVK